MLVRSPADDGAAGHVDGLFRLAESGVGLGCVCVVERLDAIADAPAGMAPLVQRDQLLVIGDRL